MFARARYANQAEAEDELTFRKDEILQVLQKDFNGQVDWWLCRLGKNVGMVPANYLEIFHPHAPKSDTILSAKEKQDEEKMDTDYDVPKSKSSTLSSSSQIHQSTVHAVQVDSRNFAEYDSRYADYDFPRGSVTAARRPVSHECEEDIYDLPPREEDPDYDLPPVEISISSEQQQVHPELHERPPSSNKSLSNRYSTGSGSQIYDIPPTSPSALYDLPPPDLFQPATQEGRSSRPNSGEGMDLSKMYENEAEEFLKKYSSEIEKKFDTFWQCVYGTNAYWGSDNKVRRKETLSRTVSSAKDFNDSLTAIVDFGKGVATALEISNTKDVNFKRKFLAANAILMSKSHEIVSKIDVLVDADEKDVPITATVKMLLETARVVPQAVQAFVILVQANKAILFKSSAKQEQELLPVLTKNEVKNRPLPDLPESKSRSSNRLDSTGGDDYADINIETVTSHSPTPANPNPATNQTGYETTGRRRNPNDTLPPLPSLPFATLKKPNKKDKAPPPTTTDGDDYDDIDGDRYVPPPPPPIPPRTDNYLSVASTTGSNSTSGSTGIYNRNHLVRQSSGSNHSNSSDGGTSSPRRSRSPDRSYNSPYGTRVNSLNRSDSPSQPLKHEDRELLTRYGQQMDLLIPGLKDAMETFIASIRNSEGPSLFVTKSKLAVIAAYKLVYIADSLYQKLLHNDIKANINVCCNQLTDTIKSLVSETKTAALQYPNVGSLERMHESLRKLFPAALDLVTSVKNPNV